MLPRETSERQLKMLRKLTKGTDIGDLTAGDRLNHNIPNLQYIGNPVDMGIDSYEDFTEKDNQLQTIAFKSKLCNKPLVKENKQKNMKKMNNLISLNEYHSPDYEPLPSKVPEELEPYYLDKLHKRRYAEEPDYKEKWDEEKVRQKNSEEEINRINAIKKDLEINRFDDFEEEIAESEIYVNDDNVRLSNYKDPKDDYDNRDVEPGYYEEYPDEDDSNRIARFDRYDKEEDEDIIDDEDIDDDLEDDEDIIQNFESFKLQEAKEEKQPEYTLLGKEKEPKSDPNFGYAAVRDQEIKKIGSFTDFTKMIDPPTPKERSILNAGVFIDNDKVKGYVNRIDGKDVYVESLEEPMVIKKFSIKDAIKTKKEEK